MSYFLLDTNICVHLLKNEYSVKDKIELIGPKSCFLSEITIAELLYGIENSALERKTANLARLEYLQRLFSGRILTISGGLHEYARQKTVLKRMGRPVGDFDLLIGATAIAHGLTLVTRNTRDFSNLQGIVLENWIDTP